MKRTRPGEDPEKSKFQAHCNVCCEVLTNPEGLMSSCKHFFCYDCCGKHRVGEKRCLICGAGCRYMKLRQLPQDVRGVLVTDAFRQLALAAQAVQWQFGQTALNLKAGAAKITYLRRQKQALDGRIKQLQHAVTKLKQDTWLEPPTTAKPASSTSQLFVDHVIGNSTPLQRRDPPHSVFATPQSTTAKCLFNNTPVAHRPGTGETSFTNIMANIGL
eukprot:TRINITY_DN28090_c0_g1_i1.p1 TRINITY_DN28090_c0_g1~~TRINITY_DN28090_c0_g1_i1.p1  ORF type:complete len:216 (+),score=37.61 TRINITY_DN28090_c0_g1_i1:41-688(+)